MICSKCGAVLKDTAKFCSFCGTKIEEQADFQEESENVSSNENVYARGSESVRYGLPNDGDPAAEKLSEEAETKPAESLYTAEQEKQTAFPDNISAETEKNGGGITEKPKRSGGGKKLGAIIAAVIAVAVIGAGAAAYPSHIKPYIEYSGAVKAMNAGSYEEAAADFEALGDYKDSSAKAEEAYLALAESRMSGGDYDGALAVLDTVPDSENSQELRKKCLFGKADKLEQSGDHGAAADIFLQLGDYSGASERYASALTAYADSLAEKGEYVQAVSAAEGSQVPFDEEKLTGYRVGAAEAYAAKGDYAAAAAVLEPAADSYYNGVSVAMLLKDYSYNAVISEIEKGNAEEHLARQLAEIGSYKDSTIRFSQLCLTIGDNYFNEGFYREAAAVFTNAGTFGNASERLKASLYKLAEKYAADGDNASARSVYLTLGNYSDSRKKASEAAAKLGNADHKNWYVSADTYAGSFCTAKFVPGETVTVSGTLMNSRSSAAPDLIVLAEMPDGSTSSVMCGDIAADGKFTVSFETAEDMSGTMEFRIMLTDKGVLLRTMTAEIG